MIITNLFTNVINSFVVMSFNVKRCYRSEILALCSAILIIKLVKKVCWMGTHRGVALLIHVVYGTGCLE